MDVMAARSRKMAIHSEAMDAQSVKLQLTEQPTKLAKLQAASEDARAWGRSVSYTHLTLPTTPYV